MILADCILRVILGMTNMDQRSMSGNGCKHCCLDHRKTEKISTTESISVLVYLQEYRVLSHSVWCLFLQFYFELQRQRA